MSSHVNYRRAAAANAASFIDFESECECRALVPYDAPKKVRKAAMRKLAKRSAKAMKRPTLPKLSAEEAERQRRRTFEYDELVNVAKRTQLEVIVELSRYFRKKSNLAVVLGALQECDRTFYEALMGDAALRALPYFDPGKGVKRTTFLIEAVENFLIDNSRYENRLKRKAITVPLTTMEIVEAEQKGMMSEEEIEDRSRGGWEAIFFRMDFNQFYATLTDTEKLYLEWRIQGFSFDEIAKMAGYSKNTFRRNIWRVVQEKAVKFGGMQGKMIEA